MHLLTFIPKLGEIIENNFKCFKHVVNKVGCVDVECASK